MYQTSLIENYEFILNLDWKNEMNKLFSVPENI